MLAPTATPSSACRDIAMGRPTLAWPGPKANLADPTGPPNTEDPYMIDRRVMGLVAAVAIVAAACSGGSTPAPSSEPSAAASQAPSGDCVVGVSWNNFQEERWGKFDFVPPRRFVESVIASLR